MGKGNEEDVERGREYRRKRSLMCCVVVDVDVDVDVCDAVLIVVN